MITISDVAKHAGVSTMTVSRVINNSGHASPEARERVERAIRELGYVPNALARSLRFKQTKTIALIVTDIRNPFFNTVARGVEDVTRAAGFSVIFCNTDETESEERDYLALLLQKQVDGFLLVPASDSSASLALLKARGVPVTVLDRRIEAGLADVVRSDSEGGAYMLVQHLLGLGHTRIAVLSGSIAVSTAVDRVDGYRRALREAGIAEDQRLVFFDQYTQGDGYRMALQALQLNPRPSAIFAANNLIALGAMRAVHECGLRVPEDLSLVSFDDLPQEMLWAPFLTVAAQPVYAIGQRAAELLLERLVGEANAKYQEIVLPTELIVRKSSAPPVGRERVKR